MTMSGSSHWPGRAFNKRITFLNRAFSLLFSASSRFIRWYIGSFPPAPQRLATYCLRRRSAVLCRRGIHWISMFNSFPRIRSWTSTDFFTNAGDFDLRSSVRCQTTVWLSVRIRACDRGGRFSRARITALNSASFYSRSPSRT